MARVIFRANVAPLREAWRMKRSRVTAVAGLGAIQIAEATNASLIPNAFPGRVRASVHAEVASPAGNDLARVVGVVDKPLFWWYTKGTATYVGKGTYPIDPIRASVLAFDWKKVGRFVFLSHVENPGTRPHPEEMAAFLASLRAEAYDTWRLLLLDLLLRS